MKYKVEFWYRNEVRFEWTGTAYDEVGALICALGALYTMKGLERKWVTHEGYTTRISLVD
jgi:hypothetical protein